MDNDLDILLVGRSGHGKTSTGNSILGRKTFKELGPARNVQAGYREHEGRVIKLVDVLGFCHRSTACSHKDESVKAFIGALSKGLSEFPLGFNAVVFVFSYNEKITSADKGVVEGIKTILGEDILKNNGVCIMTHADDFQTKNNVKDDDGNDDENNDGDDEYFQKWCRNRKGFLKSIFEECQFRCVAFNNANEDPGFQKKQLLKLVNHLDTIEQKYTQLSLDRFSTGDSDKNKDGGGEHQKHECKLPKILENIKRQTSLIEQAIYKYRCSDSSTHHHHNDNNIDEGEEEHNHDQHNHHHHHEEEEEDVDGNVIGNHQNHHHQHDDDKTVDKDSEDKDNGDDKSNDDDTIPLITTKHVDKQINSSASASETAETAETKTKSKLIHHDKNEKTIIDKSINETGAKMISHTNQKQQQQQDKETKPKKTTKTSQNQHSHDFNATKIKRRVDNMLHETEHHEPKKLAPLHSDLKDILDVISKLIKIKSSLKTTTTTTTDKSKTAPTSNSEASADIVESIFKQGEIDAKILDSILKSTGSIKDKLEKIREKEDDYHSWITQSVTSPADHLINTMFPSLMEGVLEVVDFFTDVLFD